MNMRATTGRLGAIKLSTPRAASGQDARICRLLANSCINADLDPYTYAHAKASPPEVNS